MHVKHPTDIAPAEYRRFRLLAFPRRGAIDDLPHEKRMNQVGFSTRMSHSQENRAPSSNFRLWPTCEVETVRFFGLRAVARPSLSGCNRLENSQPFRRSGASPPDDCHAGAGPGRHRPSFRGASRPASGYGDVAARRPASRSGTLKGTQHVEVQPLFVVRPLAGDPSVRNGSNAVDREWLRAAYSICKDFRSESTLNWL